MYLFLLLNIVYYAYIVKGQSKSKEKFKKSTKGIHLALFVCYDSPIANS